MNLDGPHEPGPEKWWSEAWHLDAARVDGTGLTVRLDCYPNQNVAWFWAYLVLPDLPGPVVVRDHEVPLPRQGLEIRAEGLWAELWCETPLEHWTYGLEAFGLQLDDPADALTDEDEIGERVAVGLDLEWEIGGPTHERGDGWPTEGIVQPGIVHGEVLLGRSRIEFDGRGERRHTWGVRDWGTPAWSVAFAGPDLAVHVSGVDGAGVDGFVWRGGEEADPVGTARVEAHRGANGLPVAARVVVDGEWEIDVELLGSAPLRVDRRSTLARAVCRATSTAAGLDETVAVGWSSWLTPA